MQTSLGTAQRVANLVTQNVCVQVESPHGTGAASVLVSLAMVFASPFFRTAQGFVGLIEREWVQMGYPFAEYNGVCSSPSEPVEFVLFLHCVQTIVVQHPTAFEFSSDWLVRVLDELYGGGINTFLFNSEKERRRETATRHSNSLYDIFNLRIFEFLNRDYRPKDRVNVNTHLLAIPLWCAYYLRFTNAEIARLNYC